MAITTNLALEVLKTPFQANGFTKGNQLAPTVLGLSNGGFVVAYNNGDIDQGKVLLDFYGADLVKIGSTRSASPLPNSSATGQPTLTELPDGTVLVAWDENASNAQAIRGSYFQADGTALLSGVALTSAGMNWTAPSAATQSDGSILLASIFNGDVKLNKVVQGENGLLSSTIWTLGTTGVASDSQVAVLKDDGFVVTWTSTDGASKKVMARVFNADSIAVTNAFAIGPAGHNSQSAIAALPNGNWAVAYVHADAGAGTPKADSVRLQIFNAQGQNVTPGGAITVWSGNRHGADPSVTVLDNGFIVVTLTSKFAGTDPDIAARVYDQKGQPVDIGNSSNLFYPARTSTHEELSSIAVLKDGRFVTAWQDSASDGGGGRITAQVSEIVRTTKGDADSNVLKGDALRDIIYGYDGDDIIDGKGGADKMVGGKGNDTYYVDNPGDVVVEKAAQGIDTVISRISYVLPDHVENLTLRGTDNLDGTGNALDNVIYGNSGDNILDGKAGADTMRGGKGNDTYVVDHAGDVVIEKANEGTDHVISRVDYKLTSHVENLTLKGAALKGTGNALDNIIIGTAGDNVLDGRGGADSMIGGKGNDTYYVDNLGDIVVEKANQGIDTVISTIGYKLPDHVENLTLAGSANIFGGGNALDNVIKGNSGNNTLDGGAGADTMIGGNGNDVYWVDDAGDVVIEKVGEGIDAIHSTVSYVLPKHVETLYLKLNALNGTGNAQDNIIFGNDKNNVLKGGAGDDALYGGGGDDILIGGTGDDILNGNTGNNTLTGGAGADRFVFSANLLPSNIQTITDFEPGVDRIILSTAIFPIGHFSGVKLAAEAFKNLGEGAVDDSDRILYDPSTGKLFCDRDGSADAYQPIHFATLANVAVVTADDFYMI